MLRTFFLLAQPPLLARRGDGSPLDWSSTNLYRRTRCPRYTYPLMSKPFYITTPLYYVNAPPSWGVYTTIVADAVRRHKQMLGLDVFLTTGTDEHGQKIERSAKAAGMSPKELADRVADQYKQLWKQMGIEYDAFIRTTDAASCPGRSRDVFEGQGGRLYREGPVCRMVLRC